MPCSSIKLMDYLFMGSSVQDGVKLSSTEFLAFLDERIPLVNDVSLTRGILSSTLQVEHGITFYNV